jgi:dUTP pyrophosphatase
MSNKSIKPLKWTRLHIADTPFRTYTIQADGNGKIAVDYESKHGQPATGFETIADAKQWAFKHYAGEMQPYIRPDKLPNIQVKVLDKDNPLPVAATQGSAGIDLRASLDEPLLIKAGETQLVGTGIAIYIKDPRFFGMILPRSGLGSKHGIVLGNLVGVIDSDYQGELMVSVWNRSKVDYMLEPGAKFAQYLVMPIETPMLRVVDDFDDKTDRGAGGFGSTGN